MGKEFCHVVAGEILDFDQEYAEVNGQILEDVNCVYYEQPGENGNKLIVSLKDNSILWAGNIINIRAHIKAFKKGIRTDRKVLEKVIR